MRVRAYAAAHHLDVGPHLFGQQRQFVHEADARGQHGIGGVLGEFGAAHIHQLQAVVVAHERGVQGAHQENRPFVVGADDDAVWLHAIVDCGAFLQELGVRHDGKVNLTSACGKLVGNGGLDLISSANRHGALVDHHLVVGHVPPDVSGGGQHVLQVGRAVFVRWRSHADELQRAMAHGVDHIRGELQPSSGNVALHQGIQPRLEDGNAPVVEQLDLLLIHVQAQHVVAHLCQAGACHQAHIARANNGDFHSPVLSVLQ
jgi:hypothetical protein